MKTDEFKQEALNSFLTSKGKGWRHCSVSVSIFSSISGDTCEDTIQCFISNEDARIAFAMTLIMLETRIAHLVMIIDNGIELKINDSQEGLIKVLSLFSGDLNIQEDSEEALKFTRNLRDFVKDRFAEIGGIY